jgi:hypothetical protein
MAANKSPAPLAAPLSLPLLLFSLALDRRLIAAMRSGVTAAAGIAGLLLLLTLLTLLSTAAVGGETPGGLPGGGDVTRPIFGGFVDAIAALMLCSHSRALASLCSAICSSVAAIVAAAAAAVSVAAAAVSGAVSVAVVAAAAVVRCIRRPKRGGARGPSGISILDNVQSYACANSGSSNSNSSSSDCQPAAV